MGGRNLVTSAITLLVLAAGTVAYAGQAAGYPAVKACSLVPLAQIKKLAPWPPEVDRFAKAEDMALPGRSVCVYPTAQVQVEQYRAQTIDSARKSGRLDPVPGVGDEAYVRNNSNFFALLYTKVGPHLLTVEVEIPQGKTFETTRPMAIEIAKVFVAKLR